MGMTTGSINANAAYIKYIEEDEIPYLQACTKQPKNVVFKWLFFPETTYYTVYLPEGSVIENAYEVDFK